MKCFYCVAFDMLAGYMDVTTQFQGTPLCTQHAKLIYKREEEERNQQLRLNGVVIDDLQGKPQ